MRNISGAKFAFTERRTTDIYLYINYIYIYEKSTVQLASVGFAPFNKEQQTNEQKTNKKKIAIFAISDAAGLRNNKFTYHDQAATFYKFPNKIT